MQRTGASANVNPDEATAGLTTSSFEEMGDGELEHGAPATKEAIAGRIVDYEKSADAP